MQHSLKTYLIIASLNIASASISGIKGTAILKAPLNAKGASSLNIMGGFSTQPASKKGFIGAVDVGLALSLEGGSPTELFISQAQIPVTNNINNGEAFYVTQNIKTRDHDGTVTFEENIDSDPTLTTDPAFPAQTKVSLVKGGTLGINTTTLANANGDTQSAEDLILNNGGPFTTTQGTSSLTTENLGSEASKTAGIAKLSAGYQMDDITAFATVSSTLESDSTTTVGLSIGKQVDTTISIVLELDYVLSGTDEDKVELGFGFGYAL